ncbi:hypothetical protein MJ575_07900 [Klebsiella pneumoniae]|nr:hypothetical protein MJ575_07900 [Klebsiella pneumoniae]
MLPALLTTAWLGIVLLCNLQLPVMICKSRNGAWAAGNAGEEKRARIARRNLELCFPEMSAADARTLLVKNF